MPSERQPVELLLALPTGRWVSFGAAGRRAPGRRAPKDAVAHIELGYLGTNLFDNARLIKARNNGIAHLLIGRLVETPTNAHIRVIDRKGLILKHHTIGRNVVVFCITFPSSCDEWRVMAVSFQREVNCGNGCSMCFDEFCGVLSTTEATSFKGGYTSNFTVTDLIAIGSEENETVVEETLLARLALSVGSFQEKTCFDALEGASGEICFATDFSFESDTGVGLDDFEVAFRTQGEASCSVTANGDECKSCEFDLALGCTLMDCTNLLKNTMLNTCTGSREEFPGVFGAMYVIQAEVESTNFTLGTCDLTDARTSAPTSSSGGFGRFLFAGAATSVLLVLVGM